MMKLNRRKIACECDQMGETGGKRRGKPNDAAGRDSETSNEEATATVTAAAAGKRRTNGLDSN